VRAVLEAATRQAYGGLAGGRQGATIYALLVDVIDWRTAQRIGERIAGSPPRGSVRAELVQPRAYEFAERVSAYSGLRTPAALPPVEAVDRSAWIAANLRSMRPMMAPLTERLSEGSGALAGPIRAASGVLLGAQIGALTGALSQRVLGQYDLALLDATVQPRLLLLAPNLSIAARSLSVDSDDLVLWVAIHEITHAVQFSAVAWLRGHLGGLIEELLASVQLGQVGDRGTGADAAKAAARARGRMPSRADVLELIARVRHGETLRWTVGEDRWQLIERIQAAMSVIEGHAEHAMDAIGAELLPSLPRLRAAMTRRRSSRPLYWRVIERLLGLELKLRQYEVGRQFCDEIVAADGTGALARLWENADALPSLAELERPGRWLARTRVPAAS
jgi:coenzyme F420 biosynthesis associated uncharacterized protein